MQEDLEQHSYARDCEDLGGGLAVGHQHTFLWIM